jgi:triosephosphate isomerase
VLGGQVTAALLGVVDAPAGRTVVIGYEPLWAIGPGKIPPGQEYIAFVSELIKGVAKAEYGMDVPVVYGGGLKVENAAMIAGIPTVDGGLVGLTRFAAPIGFDVDGLASIIAEYRRVRGA